VNDKKMLDGKVIVVTGGGRGIGRATCLMLAEHGAKVVVNDIGGGADGAGNDQAPADEVVSAIREAGGEAVSSFDSVTEWDGGQAIIQTALDTFGQIDCVVNNAGNLRDGIFHKMSEQDFESVLAVHLKGSFNVSRAAAPHFRQQGSGTFVNMTSTSGLIGNFGQANYSAAKMGIVGLSKSMALDMDRFGVTSNCIAPFAWSRLIGSIPTEDEAQKERVAKIQKMTPDKISTLVVSLCSDQAKHVTGQIFGVRNNEIFLFSQPRPIRSAHTADGWTPETILSRVMPAFEADFYPLSRSADIFSWDPF
jgi:NAD(P)-dependent dehydrogenase (short-subunit alcohol dehydrogenase family)